MTKRNEPTVVAPSVWPHINLFAKENRIKLSPKYLLLTPFLVVLGGCQTIYKGKYEWDAGWRPGTVLEVGSADHPSQILTFDADLKVASAMSTPACGRPPIYGNNGRSPCKYFANRY